MAHSKINRILVTLLLCYGLGAHAQSPGKPRVSIADATVAAGSSRGTFSLGYYYDWQFGSSDRLGIGLGARYTGFLGLDLYYVTAPAELTSGKTGPLVIFTPNINANIDTLVLNQSFVHALNVLINIDYKLSKRVTAGFNIDAVGFSFGGRQPANYINGTQGKNTSSIPTRINVLLTSDNDRGSLNSEAYLRYALSEKWAIKLAAQFIFTEYMTAAPVQQFPKENDRFRNKSLLAAAGISLRLK